MSRRILNWPASGRIEEVRWLDHCGGTGWAVPDHYNKDRLGECRSVGYVLSEDRDVLRIIQSQDAVCGKLNDSLVIGKKLIISRRVLRRK